MNNERPEIVTASEIADFVYCGEAWRLRALGTPSANQPEQARGISHHAHKAIAERVAGGAISFGFGLIALAALALALIWFLGR